MAVVFAEHDRIATAPKTVGVLALFIGIAAVSCAPPPFLADAARVWCANHPMQTVAAGVALEVTPSRFVRHAAEVEQAVVEGDWARAQSLVSEWNAQQATGGDSDPHPGMGAMLAWETDAPEDFRTACLEAYRMS